jgi:hypothetical protein
LIARALGAAVRRNPKEIGWYRVHSPAAPKPTLFRGLSTETVFHWHGETFDLPPRAELLASSDLCRNQAFRIGDHLYGLQFHLEVTPEMIAAWSGINDGDVRELRRRSIHDNAHAGAAITQVWPLVNATIADLILYFCSLVILVDKPPEVNVRPRTTNSLTAFSPTPVPAERRGWK